MSQDIHFLYIQVLVESYNAHIGQRILVRGNRDAVYLFGIVTLAHASVLPETDDMGLGLCNGDAINIRCTNLFNDDILLMDIEGVLGLDLVCHTQQSQYD